jgi:WhiB family redox-sensing transcriptional regulator
VVVNTLDTRNSWRTRAACRGPETALFFPPSNAERREDRDVREARAKAICGECPVRRECLDHAVQCGEAHGIWGGLNEHERRGLLEVSCR